MIMKKQRLLFMVLGVALLLCGSVALSEAISLPDTGQTKCYQSVNPYAEIPCDGTGQDGAYTINPMSYTDNGNGTITDNVTGIMWQKEDDNTNYNWYQASGTYHATYNPSSQDVCGSLVLGGYSDWRLPAKKELVSIVDYSIPFPGPTINTTYFPNTNSGSYWSSNSVVFDPGGGWYVGFIYGDANVDSKVGSIGVRCVRGNSYLSQSFTDNDNGTVTDSGTGLMWQQAEGGSMTWDNALSYCEGLSLGGYSDWRLPNIKELESLTDDTRYNPAIDTNFFPDAHASYYCSSTTAAGHLNAAYGVPFYGSAVNDACGRDGIYNYVRCVRSAQFNLNISKSGTGSGTVTSSDEKISCGSDCSEAYSSGTSVTLTATADTGSTFSGWSGDCTGTGTCTVTMDADKTVTATFTKQQSIDITITPPSNTTVSQGSKLGPFSISIKSNGSSYKFYTYYGYIDIVTPDGKWTVLKSRPLTLIGGSTFSANNLYINIPSTASTGTYSFWIGIYNTSNLLADDSFTFTVTSSTSKSGKNHDWRVSGW